MLEQRLGDMGRVRRWRCRSAVAPRVTASSAFLVCLRQVRQRPDSARSDTPARLAAIRTVIEERAYRIRRDAIMARSYEEILVSGTSRIAAYYKGGVKPETIAQFIQALSTAGLIPAISLR
mgnify:CR=1 FL=1